MKNKTELRIKASFYEALANIVADTENAMKYYLKDDGTEPTLENDRVSFYYFQAYKLLVKKLEELEP